MSLWIPCPLVLDEPVKLGPYELDDLCLIMASLPVLALFVETMYCILGMLGLACAIALIKRGRSVGAILHGLHDWGLPLPNCVPAQEITYGPW